MLERPAIKPHFRVEIVAGEGVVVLAETAQEVLVGARYELLTPYLDGRWTVDGIVTALRGQVDPAEVRASLAALEKRGVLTEGGLEMPTAEAARWSVQGIDPRVARERLGKSGVSVVGLGNVTVEPFCEVLRSLGVRVGSEEPRQVVVTDDYRRSELATWNDDALRTGRPWLLVKPVGVELWVGPVFVPERTGCWECLVRRLRGNQRLEAFLAARRGGVPEPIGAVQPSTVATVQIAWSVAASAIATWVAGDDAGQLQGTVLSLDTRTWRTTTHALAWQPQCPACGVSTDGLEAMFRPVVLEQRRKTFTRDGGHRVRSPEATLERYERHVSPITGAVSRLERVDRSGVAHGYAAGLNVALPTGALTDLGTGLRGSSAGKGITDAQARTSALCEALERYSGVYQGSEPRRRARMADLGDAAIHPNACMGFSARQYRTRDQWNAACARKHAVPVPFEEDASVHWTPLWSLTRREQRFLPTALCFYAYPVASEAAMCVACSNGNAAGNTLEEAILQGLLELVERDSAAVWWYTRLRRPAIALESFDEPYLEAARAHLGGHDRDLWVLDLTSDLGIPAAVAVSRRMAPGAEEIMVGFGAHLDPRIAVLRAVTELQQLLLPWLSRGDRGMSDRPGREEAALRDWLMTATVAEHPYLVPDPTAPPRPAASFPREWSDDLLEDIRTCQAKLERLGLELMVLDQTRPDIELPVVKVFVPGLRHFWPRFGPGRLYEVPARLGWLDRPPVEENLNPVPLFV